MYAEYIPPSTPRRHALESDSEVAIASPLPDSLQIVRLEQIVYSPGNWNKPKPQRDEYTYDSQARLTAVFIEGTGSREVIVVSGVEQPWMIRGRSIWPVNLGVRHQRAKLNRRRFLRDAGERRHQRYGIACVRVGGRVGLQA